MHRSSVWMLHALHINRWSEHVSLHRIAMSGISDIDHLIENGVNQFAVCITPESIPPRILHVEAQDNRLDGGEE